MNLYMNILEQFKVSLLEGDVKTCLKRLTNGISFTCDPKIPGYGKKMVCGWIWVEKR